MVVRAAQISHLEDQNKKITSECQVLTVRILEEKAKMVEIMNEANHMFEGSSSAAGSRMT